MSRLKDSKQTTTVNSMKWYLLGIGGKYFFWFRDPDDLESGFVYQATEENVTPHGEAGYYNLEMIMKLKGVNAIEPAEPGTQEIYCSK